MQCLYIIYYIEHIMCNLQALGNDLQVTKSGVEEFLPAATVMVVSVTASTTQGLVVYMLYIFCKETRLFGIKLSCLVVTL